MSIPATNLALTAAGQALKAKIEKGDNKIALDITRIVTASGTSDDPLNLTAVVNEQQQFTITGKQTIGARTTISTVLTNIGLSTGYSLSQIGFYAIDPDDGEILYRISQFPEPNYVPTPTQRGWTYTPTFNFLTGNASEVKVNIDLAGIATTLAIWNSVEISDADAPSTGVKTQYFTIKDVPNYTPSTPPDPTPDPDDVVDAFIQEDDGTLQEAALQIDGGTVQGALLSI